MKTDNLILEIGTEELPASFIEPALNFLKEKIAGELKNLNLTFSSIKTHGTPRRLIVICSGIPVKQEDREKLFTGPSWKAAFDENGNPTKAAEGFARSKGVKVEDLLKIETEKGIYVGVKKKIEGKETKELLKKTLPEIIKKVPFKKSMRWGNKSVRFGRPIRWICAVFGDEKIEFDLEGIKSGEFSQGHRFLASEKFDITQVGNFIKELENRYVVPDTEERKQLIYKKSKELAEKSNGRLLEDIDLLEEVTNLVEYPYPIAGTFEKEFLKLPKEVPITVMKEHQRYFSVVDKEGNLKNTFIAVANIKPVDENIVRHGYEKVLKARLSDALFFFNEDRKTTLESKVPKLKGIMFHDKLGTMFEKVKRLEELTPFIANLINGDERKAKRAAYLSKADLATEMVKEFTELQGVMGKNYALLDNENDEVAEAILEQYLPRSVNDSLSKTKTGIALSVAEKTDNLVGFFGIGEKPSGSVDPFALRRNAIGLIKTIMHHNIFVNLPDIIEKSFKLYGKQGKTFPENTPQEILVFIKERLKIILSENFRHDSIEAAINSSNNINDIAEIAKAIDKLRKKEEFEEVLITMRRVMNIIPEDFSPLENIEPTTKYEKELLKAFSKIKTEAENDIINKEYKNALLKIKELKFYVDALFDNVMIMDKDEEKKNTRLTILYNIAETLSKLADFRKING